MIRQEEYNTMMEMLNTLKKLTDEVMLVEFFRQINSHIICEAMFKYIGAASNNIDKAIEVLEQLPSYKK